MMRRGANRRWWLALLSGATMLSLGGCLRELGAIFGASFF